MEKLRIVVGGFIGLYPTGGATWDYIQYPLGLQLLGHDVYYIEDTGQYPIFQQNKDEWNNASYCVSFLKDAMEKTGLKDRWAYRDIASGNCFGMSGKQVLEICASADVFINVSCSTVMRDEYLQIPRRILIDTDPMFTQIQYEMEKVGVEESKIWSTGEMLQNHTHLFTFGENIGADNCAIPVDFTWLTTRQPVCIDQWANKAYNEFGPITSIMNWSGRNKLVYNNKEWGQKDVEFEKIKHVPTKMVGTEFDIVLNKPLHKNSNLNIQALENLGWRVLNAQVTVANLLQYRNFIISSAIEFGVAKQTYVKSNSGWFSCRSACYLAAGKPVVAQETQWSKFIPQGEGLFAFTDENSAVMALDKIRANYQNQSSKAIEIAHEYFDSSKVLCKMLDVLN